MQHVFIFVSCLLLGILVSWLLRVLLRRAARGTRWQDADIAASALSQICLWAAVFLGIDLSLPAELFPNWMRAYVEPSLLSLSILALTVILTRMVSQLFRRHAERQGTIHSASTLLQKGLHFSIYLIALMLILDAFGIKVTTMIATLGIGGLALALALQETLSNLIAGMYITIANQIRPGDVITFETHEGVIVDIGWRNTLLRKADESIVITPNSKLSQSAIVSFPSSLNSVRAKLVFQFNVDERWQYAEQIIRDVFLAIEAGQLVVNDNLLHSPAAVVRCNEAKDGVVEIACNFSVTSQPKMAELRSELFKLIYDRLKAESILLHNPHRKANPA